MKIIYVSSKYYPFPGGAEIASHLFIRYLLQNNINCSVITKGESSHDVKHKIIEQVDVWEIPSKKYLFKYINSDKPDLLMTDLIWAEEVGQVSARLKIPWVYFARTYSFPDFLWDYKHPNLVICGSEAQHRYLFLRGVPSIVMHSIFERHRYLVGNKQSIKKYVTVINPQIVKGGEIVFQIARKMTETKFLIVSSWEKNSNLKLLNKFKSLNNVVIKRNIIKISEIYSKTKILLVPSIWNEVFGRVCIEALQNGIPVITTGKGGIKEAIGDAGIVIKDYNNIDCWIQKINSLENQKEYLALTDKSIKISNELLKKYEGEKHRILTLLISLNQSGRQKYNLIHLLSFWMLYYRYLYLLLIIIKKARNKVLHLI